MAGKRDGAAERAKARKLARLTPKASQETNAAGSRRRRELLRVAAMRFAEFGFEPTTIRDIAEGAHILSGSIYHHFATKEDMLHDIIRAPLMRLRDATVRVSQSKFDPEQKLIALVVLWMSQMIEEGYASAILYNERKMLRRNPQFDYVANARAEMYDIWRKILRAGIRSGHFKPSLDPFLAISTIVRMLNTGADWFRHSKEHEDVIGNYSAEQMVDFHLDVVLSIVRHRERMREAIDKTAADKLVPRVPVRSEG